MVDFKKHLTGTKAAKPVDPVKLYDTLDRAHDKGPLRPAQLAVLEQWFSEGQNQKDVIVKLHTGQGKTLIGLLMLQARLNAGKGPALYLCPNNFLITQTCEQAKQFGIATCTAEPNLPTEFMMGQRVLVTSVQKLFNGLTKFGLNRNSLSVDTLLMDDAHACADDIRQACRIRIPSDEPAYNALITLFANDLEAQGMGTFADISNGNRDALVPVPYWSWISHESEVARILSAQSDRASVKFGWPLLKNMLANCQCVISGSAIELEPYVAPLNAFGTYWKANHRIFMSATVTDDAFLVKGLQLSPATIKNPLSYSKETWSGEKMVLLPSLIHDDLSREKIVASFGAQNARRPFGQVVLAPSFNRTRDWEAHGAIVAKTDTLSEIVGRLKAGSYSETVILVNRYDGVDLPDDACRVLIFDSRPFSESLTDLYQEACRPNSEATLMRTIRTVEQGMGRSVRGEKDYSVIIVVGEDLVRLVRDQTSRKYLSAQMAAQIELGVEIAELAKQEIDRGQASTGAFNKLISQCLGRDPDWKAFYVEQMDKVTPKGANGHVLDLYSTELLAEQDYMAGDYASAARRLQGLLDAGNICSDDKGWYLQEMARYNYQSNRTESQHLQVAAHKCNRMLLKPPFGVTVAKLTIVSQGRMERIADWIRTLGSYSELDVRVSDILGNLAFGSKSEKFEQALDELSRALGFAGERPDKEWKEGPDNLWALDNSKYLLWECKNEVDVARTDINKREAEQMNRSNAWFDRYYPSMDVKRLMIHPAYTLSSGAALMHDVEVVRVTELGKLVKAVKHFFKSFESLNFQDLSPSHIQQLIDSYKLGVSDFFSAYSKKVRDI